MKRFIFCMLSVATLSACGGGSDNQIDFATAPVKVFSDGAGVGSVSYTTDGQSSTGYIITPELTAVLADLESQSESVDVPFDGIAIVGTGPNTVLREGATTIDGISFNVYAITNIEEDVGALFVQEPISGISFITTEGFVATNIPSSGLATYNGSIGISPRTALELGEVGTFVAEVNFNASDLTVLFDGSTASYSATGTASISSGSFSSSTMEIGTPSGTTGGSLRGDFHNDGAADMAGVIYSNDPNGTYVGAFVGSD